MISFPSATRRLKGRYNSMVMKKQYMSDDDFALLEQSLSEALEFETGKRNDLRVTKLPPPPKPLSKGEIVQIRRNLSASQAVFACLLNISVKTVRAWESGTRVPSDASLKLLTIAKEHPHILFAETPSKSESPKSSAPKNKRAKTRASL